MKMISNDELQRIYEQKKASAKERLIPFTLSLEEFSALYKHRDEFKCFYTDKDFNLDSTEHKDYPTLERLDSTGKGYEVGNVVWCTHETNKLKSLYIENQRSMKGLGHNKTHIVQRIKKVVENPVTIAERIQPYSKLFDKVNTKLKEEQRKTQSQLVEEKIKKELSLIESYQRTYKEFKKLGADFHIDMKSYRDIMRRKYCALTEEPFKSTQEKHLFVIDLNIPVQKDNVIVCTRSARDAMYEITKGDCNKIKTLVKNLGKVYK